MTSINGDSSFNYAALNLRSKSQLGGRPIKSKEENLFDGLSLNELKTIDKDEDGLVTYREFEAVAKKGHYNGSYLKSVFEKLMKAFDSSAKVVEKAKFDKTASYKSNSKGIVTEYSSNGIRATEIKTDSKGQFTSMKVGHAKYSATKTEKLDNGTTRTILSAKDGSKVQIDTDKDGNYTFKTYDKNKTATSEVKFNKNGTINYTATFKNGRVATKIMHSTGNVREYERDEKGNLLKSVDKNKSGKKVSEQTYVKIDGANQYATKTTFDTKTGKKESTYKYDYSNLKNGTGTVKITRTDSKGKGEITTKTMKDGSVTKIVTKDKKGNVVKNSEYKNGNITKEVKTSNGKKTEIKYDNSRNTKEQVETSKDKNNKTVKAKTVNFYNSKTGVITKAEYTKQVDGKKSQTSTRKYDSKGVIKSKDITNYESDGKTVKSKKSITYKNGVASSAVQYNKEGGYEKYKYEIKYDKNGKEKSKTTKIYYGGKWINKTDNYKWDTKTHKWVKKAVKKSTSYGGYNSYSYNNYSYNNSYNNNYSSNNSNNKNNNTSSTSYSSYDKYIGVLNDPAISSSQRSKTESDFKANGGHSFKDTNGKTHYTYDPTLQYNQQYSQFQNKKK